MKFLTAVILLLAVYAHHCSGSDCEETDTYCKYLDGIDGNGIRFCDRRLLDADTLKWAKKSCKKTCPEYCTSADTDNTGGCYKKNTDIATGKHYRAVAAENFVKCQQICQDDASCNMWTYSLVGITHVAPGLCFLKSEENLQGANGHPMQFVVTGPKECPGCYKTNIDIATGKHYAGAPAENYVKCQRRCQDDERCNMWTYSLVGVTHVAPGLCFLKSEENVQGERVQSMKFVVTGPKFCPDL